MGIQKYLETSPFFEIVRYAAHAELSETCIPFTGAPRKHPYEQDKMLLIKDPFSSNTLFYEFVIDDIESVEDVPSIVTENGEGLKMVRIWVRKGSFALKYEPFEVAEPLNFIKDSEVLRQSSVE